MDNKWMRLRPYVTRLLNQEFSKPFPPLSPVADRPIVLSLDERVRYSR